jgi:O-antigen/teichoic acid export membrane protein
VLKVLGAGLTFLLSVVIARFFGADGSGVYSIALTVLTIATVFGRLGMDNTVVRFVAGGAATENWVSVKGLYRNAMVLSGAASLGTSLLLVLTAPFIAQTVFHKPDLTAPIRWMALAVTPTVMCTMLAAMLQGLRRIFASTLLSAVAGSGFALLALWLVGPVFGPLGAIWAYATGSVLSAAGAWWWWHRVTPMLRHVRGEFDRRTLVESGMPLLWATSMSMAMNWIATFALGVWGTTADVGIFNAASRVTFLVSFVLIAVNIISAPKFAALFEAGELDVLASMARNSTRLMILLAAPVLVVFLAVPRTIMGIFGSEFVRGSAVLSILAVAQGANVIAGSVGHLLMMSGHERQVRNSNLVAAVTCLVCSVALVPLLHGLGAAIAVATSQIVRDFVEVDMVRRHLGIGALFLPAPAYQAVRRR